MNKQDILDQLATLIAAKGMKKQASQELDVNKANADFAAMFSQGEFGRRKAAAAFDEPLRMKVAYEATLPKVFEEQNIANNVAWADVEFPEIGAVVVPFKGAPARIERGIKRVYYKTHTTAISWDVKYDDVFTAAYQVMDETKDKVGRGLALGIDAQMFKVFAAAAASGFYGQGLIVGGGAGMSKDVINTVRGEMMKWDLVATTLMMNPVRYYEMLNVTAENVDQVTLNTIIETGYVSQFYGIKFLVNKLCPEDKAYMITEPKYLGRYVIRQAQNIKIMDVPPKLKYVVTGYINSGLVLHNMAAIYPITFQA
ncbi:MAG: hypothetical protein NC222_06200 [Staphylococcus sp.]|nr:hypothetical protein [Staphylococcus sp.]